MDNNPVLFDDLGNSKQILAMIAKLEAANNKYADSVVAQNARIAASMIEVKDHAIDLKSKVSAITQKPTSEWKGLGGIKDDFKKLTDQQQAYQDVLNRNKQLIDLNTASVNAMKQRLADLRKEHDSLDRSEAKSVTRKKQINNEVRQLITVLKTQTLVTKEAKKAVDTAEGSYDRLDQTTKQLRADLKAMPGAFNQVTGEINQHNKAAVEMQKRIEANDKALKNMDSTMGINSRRVGSYKDALKDIAGQLVGITSVAAGVAAAFAAIKTGVSIIQEMEQYDAALKAVSRDNVEFVRDQEFLQGIAEKLGVEYGTLISTYKNLKAATKDTNLEGRNTQKIFSAVVTAGAKLGLSNEAVEGTLKALVQMISKGKISAEELTQQLGEHLPSSLKLMSESLGVSTAKLYKMMEQGELIATEVMPKFATQLEKTFGLKQGEKIDRIGSGINRLMNEFKFLIKTFNETGAITAFFGAITSGLSTSLGDIRRWLKDGSVIELFTFFGAGSLTRRNQFRRDVEDNLRAFGGMTDDQRLKKLKDLKKQETAAQKEGDVDTFNELHALGQRLWQRYWQLRNIEYKDGKRKEVQAQKDAIEKDEADLTRFQAQSTRKRMAEIIKLEKDLAKDPKNEVLAAKIDVYKRIDEEQKKLDKEVKDRLKVDKPDSVIEQLNKQIAEIEETMLSKVMQDLKAGRIVDVDPKLMAKVVKLKEQLESALMIKAQIENGTFGKPITGADKPLEAITDYTGGRVGKNGKILNSEQEKELDAKRLAQLTTRLDKQVGIQAEYYFKVQRLEYDLNHDLHGLGEDRKADLMNLLAELEEAEQKNDKDEVQRLKDKYAQMIEADHDYLQTKKEIQEKYFEIGATLINGLFEIEQQNNQNRLTQLDKDRDYELSLVGDSEGAKAAIEAKYDAQRKAIQHQQDVAARNQALFNIAINTAVEVSKSLSKPGLAVAIALLGAVQAGIVLAKPLPQYAEGKNVSDTYEGPAEVGEAGRELMIRDGRASLISKRSIIDVRKRDIILPNRLTERLLSDEYAWEANSILHRNSLHSNGIHSLNRNREAYETSRMAAAMGFGPTAGAIGDAVSNAIAKHPKNIFSFDKNGFNHSVQEGNTKRTTQKNKHRLS